MQRSDEEKRRQISDRAYAIWLKEGRPHGRDLEHWAAAEQEIAATEEASPGTVRTRKPRTRKTAVTAR